jgi:hypothetical protein
MSGLTHLFVASGSPEKDAGLVVKPGGRSWEGSFIVPAEEPRKSEEKPMIESSKLSNPLT